jgi:cellulose synthase/poly-beta-1,6-N-acetylglucosamine synthase-like glycosyltransferase/peptidoglycan/xylan/chitin deacetylase (PgdA/CDA1 family)/spore germination protein YaaH
VRPHKPVFLDENRTRWRRTRRLGEAVGAFLAVVGLVFLVNVARRPDLPRLLLPDSRPALHAARAHTRPAPLKPRAGRLRRMLPARARETAGEPLRAAFYVAWDPASFASLRQHHAEIDLLVPEALHIISADGRVVVEPDPRLDEWLRTTGTDLQVMPLVNNSDGTRWFTAELGEMLASPAARAEAVAQLVAYVAGARRPGVMLDFEEVPEARQKDFTRFVTELARALDRENAQLFVALPAADPAYDYKSIGRDADAVVLMNYDQHWLTSSPGPIAAQDWFVRNLESTTALVPREKLVVAIAGYAYDWTEPRRGDATPTATAASFQEAAVTASDSEAAVQFDPETLNPHFSYEDEKGHTHQVWLTDAVTAFNQVRATDAAGVKGTALWRLGSEDPSLWPFWGERRAESLDLARLAEVPPGYDLVLDGDGDVWRIRSTPQPGRRELRLDPATRLIVGETYLTLPRTWEIDQVGGRPGEIALSFDDGPDPRFTPRILDILKSRGAPAAFFVTGLSANAHPGIVEREYAEGHEIGNHSYTHPHFDRISHAQLLVELNLTARLFESLLGARTLLFRPPYGIDHQPETAEEVELLPVPQSMGYVIVGSRIDPHDWGEQGGGLPPSPPELVRRVLEAARRRAGNIVLLHDGGGDRSATVEALPAVIDGLRAQGFSLVSVSQLLGQARGAMMPVLSPSERWAARVDRLVFDLYHWARLGVASIFLAGIALVTARALGIGLLALLEKLLRRHPSPQGEPPLVSILVPAHEEEDAIAETVRAALASDYAPLEVILVDDGSTDATAERALAAAAGDARLKLLRQPNRGKAAALNLALAEAKGEIVVTIDADTAVEPDGVRRLVPHFADPTVGAVAGNVKVGNRDRWITRWQALEYVTSQNLEKRAFDLLNCITVVPGALGAWRASVLREIGGLTPDTVAEDADLTIAVRRRGSRIRYEDHAIGWTQAPEDVKGLVAQRFRWTFGTLQAVWKHRDTFLRPRYGSLGLVALPNVLVFQILLPVFSPLIDLLFAGSLALFGLSRLRVTSIPELWTTDDVARAAIFFVAFLAIDFLTGVLAFALERDEDWALLGSFIFQRFYYRQLMYVVLVRALLAALQGRAVGWRGPVRPVPHPAEGGHR